MTTTRPRGDAPKSWRVPRQTQRQLGELATVTGMTATQIMIVAVHLYYDHVAREAARTAQASVQDEER